MYKRQENNNTNKYKASIFDGVVINDVNVIRGKATIDFGAGYIQLSHTQEVLLRTSVVKSLLQIQGIDWVLFSVNGSSLLDNDKMPVGLMEASTILTDDGQADIYSAKKKVKIYYTNETGDKLIPYLTELTVTDNVPLETQVLLALKNPPASKKNLKRAILSKEKRWWPPIAKQNLSTFLICSSQNMKRSYRENMDSRTGILCLPRSDMAA